MNSLRQKIAFGYAAVAILLVAMASFAYVELRVLEQQITAGEHIGEFFGLALEIRRFEKNYFLYRQEADLAENRAYVGQARELLRVHARQFEALADPARVVALGENLDHYKRLMDRYGGEALLESQIRHAGKEVVTAAEDLARSQHRALEALLDKHRTMLLVSVAAVAVLVAAIGHLLSRRVARPLKQLEDSMEAIAAGRLTKLDMAADDREIASLSLAFNRVLAELETRQSQLLRSEKLAALGTLLSGVAHELNNPLSNISSSCEILAEEIDGDDRTFQKELIGQIDEETWRARRIVRSLLDYARGRDFRRETLSLPRLVDDTLRLVKGQIPSQVSIVCDIPDELPISGDRQRLQQLLFNLLSNAVAATEGAGEIRLSAGPAGPGDMSGAGGVMVFRSCGPTREAVRIVVADNGHGIPAEVLPRIFDPFFTTKEVGKGLGLGLFIVYEIVEEHDGGIAVTSEPGRGTSFIIRIPTDGHHE